MIVNYSYKVNNLAYMFLQMKHALRLLISSPRTILNASKNGKYVNVQVVLSGEYQEVKDLEINAELLMIKIVPGGLFYPEFRI